MLLMGKLTISMAIVNCYVKLPEGISLVGGFKPSEKYESSQLQLGLLFPVCGKCMIYVVIDMYNCIIYNIS